MALQPLTLTHQAMWELLGISRARFYELKADGVFDHLVSPIPYRYSREKVEAWIAGRPTRRWAAAS